MQFTYLLTYRWWRRADDLKCTKYTNITSTHIFAPIAIETSGSWNEKPIEIFQEIGRRMTTATNVLNETMYLFQRLSVAIQRNNAESFLSTFPEERESHLDHWYNFNLQFLVCRLCAGGRKQKRSNNNNQGNQGASHETMFMFQRISVALQRWNAIAFRNTFPSEH